MAMIYLTDASPGAPVLSGTNGALNAVLDWALVQNGWAIERTGANARVYRPGSGNRNRLYVAHDSAISSAATLATVRGCEDANSVTALVDPFPTVAQTANNQATVCVSSQAGSTARPYRILLTPTFLLMAIGTTSMNTSGWDLLLFGDLVATDAADAYATVCLVGANASTNIVSRSMSAVVLPSPAASSRLYWCRSIDGAIKSTTGCLHGSYGASASPGQLGFVQNTPVMRAGYGNRIVREKLGANCTGSSTNTPGALAVSRRAWVPNLWNPVHSGVGSITTDDVFTDTAYAAGSSFATVIASITNSCILEISDTWSAPSG